MHAFPLSNPLLLQAQLEAGQQAPGVEGAPAAAGGAGAAASGAAAAEEEEAEEEEEEEATLISLASAGMYCRSPRDKIKLANNAAT